MSVQESIIFYYKNVNENGHSNNLSFPEFTAKVSQVIPHNITIHKQTLVPNGGLRTDLTFQKSANFIYGQSCKDKLNSLNMTADLTIETKRTRQVYLKNVPEDIYSKEIPEITEEIVKSTKKWILEVNKFPGKYDQKYITFLADCRTSRDDIVREGPLKLFGKYVDTELPIPKGQASSHLRAHSTHGRNQIDQARPTYRRPDITCPPPPRTNAWHRNHTQPPPQTYRPTQGFNGPYPPLSNGPYPPLSESSRTRSSQFGMERPPDFSNEIDRNIYTKMIDNIGKTLQSGIENPEDYINVLNSINTNYGLFTIYVPNDQLVLARDKFLSKSITTNTRMTNNSHPSNSMLNDTQTPIPPSMETDTDPSNSLDNPNVTNQSNSLDMTTDTDIDLPANLSNSTLPPNSPSLSNANDPSTPPTDPAIPPSMQTTTDPSSNNSMTNENDPQTTPSMTTNTPVSHNTPARSPPKNLPSSTATSSTPSSMSPPTNPSSTSVTSSMNLRTRNPNQQHQPQQKQQNKTKKGKGKYS